MMMVVLVRSRMRIMRRIIFSDAWWHDEHNQQSKSFGMLQSSHSTEETGPFYLLRCSPHSGRRHQIRSHLAGVQRPLVGDVSFMDAMGVHGGKAEAKLVNFPTEIVEYHSVETWKMGISKTIVSSTIPSFFIMLIDFSLPLMGGRDSWFLLISTFPVVGHLPSSFLRVPFKPHSTSSSQKTRSKVPVSDEQNSKLQ